LKFLELEEMIEKLENSKKILSFEEFQDKLEFFENVLRKSRFSKFPLLVAKLRDLKNLGQIDNQRKLRSEILK
jgi:hypothetical protein